MVPNWASELILIADMHREVLFLILPMTVRCGSRKYSAEMKNMDFRVRLLLVPFYSCNPYFESQNLLICLMGNYNSARLVDLCTVVCTVVQ